MKRQQARGKCQLCGGSFTHSGMSRHLKACGVLKGSDSAPAEVTMTGRESFHISVADAESKDYWMHLAAPVEATLIELDDFLRDTWLECCGHLSVFKINRSRYYSIVVEGYADLPMHARVGAVLAAGNSFSYEYDLGSTTDLTLKVLALRDRDRAQKKIQILARNDAAEVTCQLCEQRPATQICTECRWDEVGWLCQGCAESHKCGTDMCLPIVNSPRVGVCGYTGYPRFEGPYGR